MELVYADMPILIMLWPDDGTQKCAETRNLLHEKQRDDGNNERFATAIAVLTFRRLMSTIVDVPHR